MEKRDRKRARYSPDSVETLVSALTSLRARQPKAVSSTIHIYPPSTATAHLHSTNQGQNVKGGDAPSPDQQKYITSWKMSEHLYRRKDCPFPTLARGLFVAAGDYSLEGATKTIGGPSTACEQDRIVARGYDKFFNEGEVEWTEWDNLQKYTQAPYHLTYKSNGCLIIISALSPSQLIIGSKHSLGTTTVAKEDPRGGKGNNDKSGGMLAKGLEGFQGTAEKMQETDSGTAIQTLVIEDPVEDPTLPKSNSTVGITDSSKSEIGKSAKVNPSVATPAKGNAIADPDSLSSKKKADKLRAKAAAKAAKVQEAAAGSKAGAGSRSGPIGKSAPENGEQSTNHAEMGRIWVAKTLEKAGKSEADLAQVLWEGQLSAVAELCDDSFEEHVLAIPEHLTGLHLHGLNLNAPHFATLPPSEVEDFAQTWGFIPTPSVQLETLDEVKAYAERVGKEGKWRGEAIEGFVVRSTVKDLAPGTGGDAYELDGDDFDQAEGEPPYPPGSPFFFKIKFDEPYLMYRQWREITRTLMPLLNPKCGGRNSRKAAPWTQMGQKLKRPESAVYADWCAQAMVSQPELFEHYETGVIRVRERFLSWTENEGKEQWRSARIKSEAKDRAQEASGIVKAIVVPVAVPGTGKTVLGVALSKLFGMAHTQSDDVTTKSTAAGFLRNIGQLLATHDVVYCDRNNHLPKHHEELVDLASGLSGESNIRRIALLFDVDHHPYNRALATTSERVLSRGENHQSLRPDPEDQLRHEQVIRQFLNEFVPPEGGLFDTTIKLRLTATLRENLQTACVGLSKALRKPMPSSEDIDEALADAVKYRPEVKKDIQGVPSAPPLYYGLAMEMNLEHTVLKALKTAKGAESGSLKAARACLDVLITRSRITSRPHVTIVHEKSVASEREAAQSGDESNAGADADKDRTKGPQERLWDECAELGRISRPARFDFDLTALVWDDRVMTLVVEKIRPAGGDGSGNAIDKSNPEAVAADEKLQSVERALCEELKDVLHVTVGTRDESIAPFEARGLVQEWRKGKAGNGQEGKTRSEESKVDWIDLRGISDSGRVMGMS